MGDVLSEVLQSAAFGVAFACVLAGIAMFVKAEAAGREEAEDKKSP
jgi:hypothetical protein